MAKLKLTYFDFDGGRGEPARLALHIGGVAFEDHRIAGKDWPAFRDKTPFFAMPTLEVDGKIVSQSNSINRYVGKLAGLYPKDDWQALLCDEVMDAAEAAIRAEGIEPIRQPIRGGTDGSRLSEMGLPTPNLFTGGHEYHSVREWASLQDMAAAAAVVVRLAAVWSSRDGHAG